MGQISIFDFPRIHLKKKIGDCSIYESSKTITPSSQNLMEDFEAVEDELGHRYMCRSKALLALLAFQDSDSNVEKNFTVFENEQPS